MRANPPHVDDLLDTLQESPFLLVGDFAKEKDWKPEYKDKFHVIAINGGAEVADTKYHCYTRYPEITKRYLDNKICIISSIIQAYGAPIDLMTLVQNDLRVQELHDTCRLYSVDHGRRMLYLQKAPCGFGKNGSMIMIMTLIRNGIKHIYTLGMWNNSLKGTPEQLEIENYCDDYKVTVEALDS